MGNNQESDVDSDSKKVGIDTRRERYEAKQRRAGLITISVRAHESWKPRFNQMRDLFKVPYMPVLFVHKPEEDEPPAFVIDNVAIIGWLLGLITGWMWH